MTASTFTAGPSFTSARALFTRVISAERESFLTAAAASLIANLVALAGSLYSMQVYDRVIPTQATSTLVVLTIGALVACAFELAIKFARSNILSASVRTMDTTLSQQIFGRLLSIRIDQFPRGIGSVSSQVKSYESIRSFASAATLYVTVDAPFGLLFLGVMWMIAGIELAFVPALFFVLAVIVGLMYRSRIARHAASASNAGNRKAGLLVETIDNAETIKALGTGRQQAARWNALSDRAIDDELAIKHASESSSHFAAFVQQTSYVAMIAVGAWIASTTSSGLTTGGLIACSILSGRVLAPIGMLPGLIVQWAHARIALTNLDRVFALACDHDGVERPLTPQRLNGALKVEALDYAYPQRPPCVKVGELSIAAGEKVAILGPVGAGKSTLLKLLAGLYKPSQGRVLIDGLEMQQVSRDHLSRDIGYLAQDVRLFAGSLRDNLVWDDSVEDAVLLDACRASGLSKLIASHPKGLDMEIAEGGSGVSGGQRRLIGLTRLVLANPSVWLLDEPTAGLDDASERAALALLQHRVARPSTLVLVTHKPQLLQLVDRIVVLTEAGIALDGPRQAVLQALAQNSAAQTLRAVDSAPAPIDARKVA